MIEWYNDSELGIFLSEKPKIDVNYPKPKETKTEKDKTSKYPFELKNETEVIICDHVNDKSFDFTIPKGYTWDGATIPRIFWRLIGAKTDSRFLIPSLIHDYMCENHSCVENDRYFSTCVFERLLYVSGVSCFKRWLMKHSVDNFQKFCGWKRK